jgi:aspartate/methionine/tyrosine aminotransferase
MMQAGMAGALGHMSVEKKTAITRYYRGNFNKVYGAMAALAPKVNLPIRPDGGFFLLVGIEGMRGCPLPPLASHTLGKTHIENDVDASFALLMGFGQPEGAKCGVAVIPASAFGAPPDAMLLRVSYSSSQEEITAITDRIAQAVAATGA